MREDVLHQVRADRISDEGANAKNHDVEQTLGGGTHVFGKIFIHENVNRGEEKGVTNAVQSLDQHYESGMIGEESIDRKTSGVPQDAADHRGPPSEPFQSRPQNKHGEDFGDLADA